jgi:ubiquitin-protein ligase
MAQKRIARELADLEKAREEGKPYACGLAVDSQNLFRWRCTYTCPRYYVFRGAQRRSPYAGYVIRFQILFPTDYPFKPLILLGERAFDFFHPLVACSGSSRQSRFDVPMGSCSAIVHGVYFLDRDLWSPMRSVLKVLEEGLQPMWTEGDCWVAVSAKTAQTCVACPQHFFDDPRCHKFERNPPVFPQALPCFGGDIRPFIAQHVRGEDAKAAKTAAKRARSEEIRKNAAKKLAEVICPADETSFEIIVVTIAEEEEEEVRIQVFPSFPVSLLPTALSQATGLPENRIGRLFFRGKNLWDGTLKDCGVLEPCRVHHLIRKSNCCQPFALSGYNPVAAHLLLTDVQKFEHLARQSWSAQRVPHIAQLVCQFSFSIMRPPLTPFPFVPLTRAPLSPLPLGSLSSIIKNFITNPHQLHVISGLAMAAVRALACNSLTRYRLTLQRRVLGWAGVLRLAGHDPMALPPPGCRDHDSFLAHDQNC